MRTFATFVLASLTVSFTLTGCAVFDPTPEPRLSDAASNWFATQEALRASEEAPTATPASPVYSGTEAMAADLYDCIQVNDDFRQVFERNSVFGGVYDAGLTHEDAEVLTEVMLRNREFFVASYGTATSLDPIQGATLRDELQACEDSVSGPREKRYLTASELMASDLFDCLHGNTEFRQAFRKGYIQSVSSFMTGEDAVLMADIVLGSRESFVSTISQASRLDPVVASAYEDLLEEC